MVALVDARAFQDALLARLKMEPYAQLSWRSARERIETPRSLRGLKLYVCCKRGERGGVEVTVEAEQSFLLIFCLLFAPDLKS